MEDQMYDDFTDPTNAWKLDLSRLKRPYDDLFKDVKKSISDDTEGKLRRALTELGWSPPGQSQKDVWADTELAALVIAAREIAYDHAVQAAMGPERTAALDKALEAFAERVPWDDEPDEGDQ